MREAYNISNYKASLIFFVENADWQTTKTTIETILV